MCHRHVTGIFLVPWSLRYRPNEFGSTSSLVLANPSPELEVHRPRQSHERTANPLPYLRHALPRHDFNRPEFMDNCSAPTTQPLPPQKIPKYVHFVFCLLPDCTFGLFEYLIISAAHHSIRPTRIFFHHLHSPPPTKWWNLAKTSFITDVRKVDDVTSIFGNPVDHFAHKADVIRLQALQTWGGIYLDMDVVAIQSFDPLLHHSFVMGREGVPWERYTGLCNGVILSSPHSLFLKRWYNSYRSFDQSQWAYHSVALPLKLANKHKEEICTLPPNAMFWPAYFANHVSFVHQEEEYEFRNGRQYAYHVYHGGREYLEGLTVEKVREGKSSFLRLVKNFLPEGVGDEE
ncbi:hypothetical protein HK097_011029 [Rhizophlyctis rosea]|uniref:Alpha-1,4-N-acetylglucosaminyltransferase n=1 Tax=Rhizophlyctis rosea TaxID=64517 RepID=A0AAD5SA01_9FUNG|nr:hypothetical protein HK097_011029 [Rhizophlyctis rosea]